MKDKFILLILTMKNYYLAIDIGASSGRHIVGREEDGKIITEEVFRFPNGTKTQCGHLVWDIDSLFKNVKLGIKRVLKKYPGIRSLAIDTWGVDYVIINGDKPFMPCLSYRDMRTEAVIDEVHAIVPFEELYKRTGIQFQPFNTIYQLYDDKKRGRLDFVTDFLMIPEYLAYKLTGKKVKEYTNATTTGLVNVNTGEFDGEILKALGFSENLFPALHKPGEEVGGLLPEIQKYVGGNTKVVLCATHDTGSAVEGIPMDGEELYISSGTWSLLGVKTKSAITDDGSRKANYSNEGGVGYVRYQKNIMGMWVVNRLKEELCPEKDFAEIVREAEDSSFDSITDINAPAFLSPESMKKAFDDAFADKDIRPQKESDYFKCAFLSLAESYKTAIAELEANTGKKYKKLYIVGGGAKNAYLNELTAAATGKEVIALPIEATAIGNLKIQIKRGDIK